MSMLAGENLGGITRAYKKGDNLGGPSPVTKKDRAGAKASYRKHRKGKKK
jgi:hypothetical protein